MNKLFVLSAISLPLITACSTYRGTESFNITSNTNLVVIPFVNHSNTPMASENIFTIVSSELKEKNIRFISYENQNEVNDLKSLLDDTYEIKEAKKFLENISYDYVVTGSVDEWNYKSGLDGEPAVSVTIQIQDKNGATVYQKTGSRSGYGRESLNYCGQKVIANILDDIKVN